MRLDIRLPIGIMFVILGGLIAAFGLVSDKAIYSHSLGININLWWGLVMLIFGLFMLALAWRAHKKQISLNSGGSIGRTEEK